MVDLVKIRKKSKEAKEAAHEAPDTPMTETSPEPGPAAAAPGAPAVEPVSEPVTPLVPEVAAAEPAPVIEEEFVPPPVKTEKPRRKSGAVPAEAVNVEPAPVVTPEPEPEPEAVAALVPSAPAVEVESETEDRLARFKRTAGTRRTWSDATKREGGEAGEGAAPELELLRFRVAGEDYAVDIDKIVEIVPPRSTTRVPNAHETIVGIISLRGTIVTVLDLRRKLGHPPANGGETRDARMIVVERAGETAGFLVDRVSRVIKLDPAQLESHPVVSSSEQSEYVSGVFQASDGLVILLDLEKILAG
jgi:purine-binding chemotaxis protein CheW